MQRVAVRYFKERLRYGIERFTLSVSFGCIFGQPDPSRLRLPIYPLVNSCLVHGRDLDPIRIVGLSQEPKRQLLIVYTLSTDNKTDVLWNGQQIAEQMVHLTDVHPFSPDMVESIDKHV